MINFNALALKCQLVLRMLQISLFIRNTYLLRSIIWKFIHTMLWRFFFSKNSAIVHYLIAKITSISSPSSAQKMLRIFAHSLLNALHNVVFYIFLVSSVHLSTCLQFYYSIHRCVVFPLFKILLLLFEACALMPYVFMWSLLSSAQFLEIVVG